MAGQPRGPSASSRKQPLAMIQLVPPGQARARSPLGLRKVSSPGLPCMGREGGLACPGAADEGQLGSIPGITLGEAALGQPLSQPNPLPQW